MRWRQANGLRWLDAELPGARAAFSTRLGGVSEPPFGSLNLGILTGDDPERVRENRRLLATALDRDPDRVAIGRQVHAAELAFHESPQQPAPFAEPGSPIPEVDGHVTSVPGLAGLVFVADCLPVVVAGRGGVAVLHCGWRGLAAGIVAGGAEAVGATDAAIGPGIGPCCYEVGNEVIGALGELGERHAKGRMLDLRALTGDLLRAAGVERLEATDLCTSCEEELFFSHRRDDGATGRQAGIAWPTGAG